PRVVDQRFAIGQGDALVVRGLALALNRIRHGRKSLRAFPERLPDHHIAHSQRSDDHEAGETAYGEQSRYRGAAANPLERPLAPSRRRGVDWLTGKPAFQVLGQGLGRAVTPPRILFQALEADRFQVAIHAGIESPRPLRFLFRNLLEG